LSDRADARIHGAGQPALDVAARDALRARIRKAAARAQRSGRPAIASVTVPADPWLDVSAAVFAARRPDDRWLCIEQPDRDGHAIAGLGEAMRIEARGQDRFSEVARRCRDLARDSECGELGGLPPGTGPIFCGGFAFAHSGGASAEWGSFAPAQLVLPELSLLRHGAQAWVTLAAVLNGDEAADPVAELLEARLASLRPAPMPLIDPSPTQPARVAGAAPAEHYEGAVARAVELIAKGDVRKVVLAREVRVHAGAPIDPAAVFGALREVFPSCFSYCVGTPTATFLGASPELLVRRDGARAQTVALAGTTRRSADPSVDDHLGERLLQSSKEREEQAIVAARIEQTLGPVSLWVAAADEPVLVKVQNVQHLATPIRAQLRDPVPAVELAGLLHPTPAVGGEPWDRAMRLIPELEGLDRGWYAGPIGWTDLAEDGEFCVALRGGLLRGDTAHLYAGCGIVRDSVPAAELAETEIKLQTMLPLLA
jgi:salicylate biosynthesis isochorismate synthase/menaquinone-specific isochorismate synthase